MGDNSDEWVGGNGYSVTLLSLVIEASIKIVQSFDHLLYLVQTG